jgi:hypothetical protein
MSDPPPPQAATVIRRRMPIVALMRAKLSAGDVEPGDRSAGREMAIDSC